MNYRAEKYNSSGYLDMTAYLALRQIQREEKAAQKARPRKAAVGVWLASTEKSDISCNAKAVRGQ